MNTSPLTVEAPFPLTATSVHEAVADAVSTALEHVVVGAMHECNASCGAVVSLSGRDVRVEAACPDRSWLRSVDLYIARSLLLRRGEESGNVITACDRSYTSFDGRNGASVLILAVV